MTKYELERAQELKDKIEKMKIAADYFSPLTNGKYGRWGSRNELDDTAKDSLKLKFPFRFKLSRKTDKTADCELHIKGYFGGMSIERESR